MEHVVVETVLLVPEFDALAAPVIHGMRDMNEMFKKLTGDTFVGGVLACEFECDGQHVQAVHSHPARAVGLLKMAAGRQRSRGVEHANVVETKETALENVHALGVLAIHPPGEVQQ